MTWGEVYESGPAAKGNRVVFEYTLTRTLPRGCAIEIRVVARDFAGNATALSEQTGTPAAKRG